VQKIKNYVGEIRHLILDLFEREGWRSLGYESWSECADKEFGPTRQQVERLLDAARTYRNLSQVVDNQQIDAPIGAIPESQLRPIANLKPEQQREVYKEAVKTAPNGKMTARHMEETKKAIIRPVSFSHEPVTPPMTDEERVIKRFKIWVKDLSKEKNITSKQIHEHIYNYLSI
jgi:hypothetical protein